MQRFHYELFLRILIYLRKIQICVPGNLGCSASLISMRTALISEGVRRIELVYHLSLLLNPLHQAFVAFLALDSIFQLILELQDHPLTLDLRLLEL